MKPVKALTTLSVLLSASSMMLYASGIDRVSAYVAAASFIAASTSFSPGAQVLSMVALAITAITLNGSALPNILVAYVLALTGVIARLVLSDVRGYASRSLVAGNVALMIGMPLVVIAPLASRSLSLAEPLAVVLVSAVASYALGISYAVGCGLRVDIVPIGLKWLRGLGTRLLNKLTGVLTWIVLNALITRALTLAGMPLASSLAVATLTSLLAVFIARRSRVGQVALLSACAAASIALLREADVIGLGNTLRFIEEVIRNLGW